MENVRREKGYALYIIKYITIKLLITSRVNELTEVFLAQCTKFSGLSQTDERFENNCCTWNKTENYANYSWVCENFSLFTSKR